MRTPISAIPKDFEVKPLKPKQKAEDRCTCGYCGLSWDDAIVTSMTPSPAARCPFEGFHRYPEATNKTRAQNAIDALAAGTDFDYATENEARTYIGDLIANLLHLCHRDGIDFDSCLESGRVHFAAEAEEEKPPVPVERIVLFSVAISVMVDDETPDDRIIDLACAKGRASPQCWLTGENVIEVQDANFNPLDDQGRILSGPDNTPTEQTLRDALLILEGVSEMGVADDDERFEPGGVGARVIEDLQRALGIKPDFCGGCGGAPDGSDPTCNCPRCRRPA